MDVDATIIFAGIGACAVLGSAVMAYGGLRTRVKTLECERKTCKSSQHDISTRLRKVENLSDIHSVEIQDLKGNANKLFDLAEKQSDSMAKINETLVTMKTDIHHLVKRVDEVLDKK